MNRELFRKCVRWFFCVWVYRIIVYILFEIFFAVPIIVSVEEHDGMEFGVTVWTSIISMFLYSFACILIYRNNNGEEKRAVITASREPGFRLIRYFKKHIKELLLYTGIYAATQLGFCGFYSAFGYVYINQTFIEKIHITDVGFYLLTGSGIMGLFLTTLSMGILIFTARYIALFSWQREYQTETK